MTKILIADDEPNILMLSEVMFKEMGFDVYTAVNGQDAIEKALEIKPDIIITDIIMPDKDGIEIIIEAKKTYPNIILVAISGGGRIDSESYLNTAKYLGADATLKKPFTHDQLLDLLQNLTE